MGRKRPKHYPAGEGDLGGTLENDLEVVDICNSWCAALDLNKRDPSSYLADKIHPNKEGQQLMAETVFKHFIATSAPPKKHVGMISSRPTRPRPGRQSVNLGAVALQQGTVLTPTR